MVFPAEAVRLTRSTVTGVAGFCSTMAARVSRSHREALTAGMPSELQLPKKISAKDSAMMAWIPQRSRDWGACSREEPQPKLRPASRIPAP